MTGLNEVLAVYLMAAQQVMYVAHSALHMNSDCVQGVPVCPHAGGVGLCNMVPHLQVSVDAPH